MRAANPALVLTTLSLLGLLGPSGAHAWTSTTVRSVTAHVTIPADATAEVQVVAELHVDGGWLESFELDGLDPDLELVAERPPRFEDALGEDLGAAVENPGEGRVVFTFPRRSAPRVGDYLATVTYRTHLDAAPRDGRIRLRWTLPGWRTGLDDVSITVDGPEGLEVVEDEAGAETSFTVEPVALEGGARRVLRRAHLPRMREWVVTLEVPATAMNAGLVTPPSVAAPAVRTSAAPPPIVPGAGVVALGALVMLAVAKMTAASQAARRARTPDGSVLRLDVRIRAAMAVAFGVLGALAWWAGHHDGALGLAFAVTLCALCGRAPAPAPARLGSFQPTDRDEHRRAGRALAAERFGPAAWIDASTVPGATFAGLVLAAPVLAWSRGLLPLPLPEALVLAALAGGLMFTGTRRSRPVAPPESLAHLLAFAAGERVDLERHRPFALRPVMHADVRGELQDARLRVTLSTSPRGLLRLDVVRTARPDRLGWTHGLGLLVVTREGSPAERVLEEHLPGAGIGGGARRVARLVPIERGLARALVPVLDALASCPHEARTWVESAAA